MLSINGDDKYDTYWQYQPTIASISFLILQLLHKKKMTTWVYNLTQNRAELHPCLNQVNGKKKLSGCTPWFSLFAIDGCRDLQIRNNVPGEIYGMNSALQNLLSSSTAITLPYGKCKEYRTILICMIYNSCLNVQDDFTLQ